jgi:hemerythrin-like domain-containing protein
MDYSKAIQELVSIIRAETFKSQEQIARDLGKADNYISIVIGRGGNEKAYNLIKSKYQDILAKHIPKENTHLYAYIRVLMEDHLLLKSHITGRPVPELMDELEKKAMLKLRTLKESPDLS